MKFEEILPFLREGKAATNSLGKERGYVYIAGTLSLRFTPDSHVPTLFRVKKDDYKIIYEYKRDFIDKDFISLFAVGQRTELTEIIYFNNESIKFNELMMDCWEIVDV